MKVPEEEGLPVRLVGAVLRIYSYLFHILLSPFMMGVGGVAWLSGNESLQLGFLPWTGAALNHWLFLGGLAGLLITLLAIARVPLFPLLFLLWCAAVLVMLVRGYFFSSYSFAPAGSGFDFALYFSGAALLALIGAVSALRRDPAELRRKTALA